MKLGLWGCALLFMTQVMTQVASAVEAPPTADAIDARVAHLQQQKQRLKKRYQRDLVKRHRTLTYPPTWGAPNQERRFDANTARRLSWLARKLAGLDQKISALRQRKAKISVVVAPKPQTGADAAVSSAPYAVSILAPKTRVIWRDGQAFVRVMKKNGQVVLTSVQIGSDVGEGMIEIKSGLSVGDVIQ